MKFNKKIAEKCLKCNQSNEGLEIGLELVLPSSTIKIALENDNNILHVHYS